MSTKAKQFSFPDFKWWIGVVEDRMDPEKLGRIKVRIYGYHTDDLGKISKDNLFWAAVVNPITSASLSGIGQSPLGVLEGTTVMGFFLDGDDAQTPVVFGTMPGKPQKPSGNGGFKDPKGVNPKKPGESDVNRLSRGNTTATIIAKIKANLKQAAMAFGGQWKEPASKYAAEYPFNHVHESESGHVHEIDDTKGAERLMRCHKMLTFEEIYPDGQRVLKVATNNYTVILGNDKMVVAGNCDITVEGNASLLVQGNANIEVKGNQKEQIHGNYDLTVGGNATVKVGGAWSLTAGASITEQAPTISMN